MESLRVCLVLLLFKKIKSLTKGNCFLPAALTKAIFHSTIPKSSKEVPLSVAVESTFWYQFKIHQFFKFKIQ
jgi:hypothetical protein